MSANTEATALLQALLDQPNERQRLIALYLRREMDDELQEAFEIRLLDDRQLLSEVEVDDLLRLGLSELSPQELHDSAGSPRRSRWVIPLALAAGGLIGAVGMQALSPALPQSGLAGKAAVLQLPVSRGEEIPRDSRFALTAGTNALVLRVPATNEPGPFRLRIVSDNGVLLTEAADLTASEDGLLDVALPAPAAASAETVLKIELAVRRNDAWHERPARNLILRR